MRLYFFAILLTIGSCSKSVDNSFYNFQYTDQAPKKIYRFGVHPLYNPQKIKTLYGPIINSINSKLKDTEVILETSRNYKEFDRKLSLQLLDFALPNPYQTMKSIHSQYEVFGKMGDDQNFKGIILVRKDSYIQNPKDLKGKTICFPAPTALAGSMMPQMYLSQAGLKISDYNVKYLGSQDSAIIGTFNKTCDASGTWPPPWITLQKTQTSLTNEMHIIWETETLPNNGLVNLKGIDKKILEVFKEVFFNLHNDEVGKEILKKLELSKFESANNETYKSIEQYIDKFSKEVRNPKDPV